MITWLALLAAPICSAAPVKSEPLWREWYLVTRGGKALSAFEESAEKRPTDAQVAVTQKWTEKTENGISEAYVGSVASEDSLSPAAFFVERKGKKTYKIDGRVKGKKLEVTFKPASGAKAKSSASTQLGPGTYLSSFVPMAIARHLGEKGAFQFTAVVEDDGDMNVEVKNGIVEIQGVSRQIGSDTCHEALLRIDGVLQEWWITRQGKTCLCVFPDSGTRMEKSTEAAARKAMSAP